MRCSACLHFGLDLLRIEYLVICIMRAGRKHLECLVGGVAKRSWKRVCQSTKTSTADLRFQHTSLHNSPYVSVRMSTAVARKCGQLMIAIRQVHTIFAMYFMPTLSGIDAYFA